MNIASQKNFIGFFYLGMYANKEVYDWFVIEYGKRASSILDMEKSCVRFKKPEHLLYDLISEHCKKFTVKQWIETYETAFR
jgi:hypothetical protein